MKKTGVFLFFAILPTLLFLGAYFIGGQLLALTLWITKSSDPPFAVFAIVAPIYLIAIAYIVLYCKWLLNFCNIWILPISFALVPACFFVVETFVSSDGYFAKYTATSVVGLLYALPLAVISSIVAILLIRKKKALLIDK